MIDYRAVQQSIATEADVETLRAVVLMLLGSLERRRQRLGELDAATEPAFSRSDSDRARGLLKHPLTADAMRTLARELFRGVESLDLQIVRLRLKLEERS